MDKFLTFMKVNEEEGDEEFYEDDYEDEEPAPRRSSSSSSRARDTSDYEEEREETPPVRKPFGSSSKITPIKSSSRKLASGPEVCMIKPTSVEDAREIAETLLNSNTVLLNLEGLDVDVAQRIFDIIIGVSYAISGNLQSVSKYVFIVTPANVSLSGDFQEVFDGVTEMPFRK